ncbi:hypothetical protein RRG08_031093 [Elysia crispata]|uniref:Uncharacterized protein n=1 Tax=Elysia crispata TaxID=231223 RepID=A0AAE1DF64_9GAST|nr:hypothetical protein RRG08_031093 [Elysia crispata]
MSELVAKLWSPGLDLGKTRRTGQPLTRTQFSKVLVVWLRVVRATGPMDIVKSLGNLWSTSRASRIDFTTGLPFPQIAPTRYSVACRSDCARQLYLLTNIKLSPFSFAFNLEQRGLRLFSCIAP